MVIPLFFLGGHPERTGGLSERQHGFDGNGV